MQWLTTYQLECDTLTYRVISNTFYYMWQSYRGMAEIFEELTNEGRSFWNNVDVSMLLLQHLNWNLLVFLPKLSYFDLEHNSYKEIIKIRLLRLSKFSNSLIPLKMTSQLIFQVVIHFNVLLTYSPETVKSLIVLHET